MIFRDTRHQIWCPIDKNKTYPKEPILRVCFKQTGSLLDDFQKFHGAGLDADTAGDALGSIGSILRHDHNLEGTRRNALAAADTELLVDHVHALGVLGDCAVLTGSCALTALDTGHGFGSAFTLHDLNAGFIRMEFLIEGIGTGSDTFQTGHAIDALLYSKFLHGNPPKFLL